VPGFGAGDINDDQRNLCMQHGAGSLVFQYSYLNHHITADTRVAYQNIEPQRAMIRLATGTSRTIDERRPQHLTRAHEEEAHRHPRVQSLLRKKMYLKAQIKGQDGNTIIRYDGTEIFEEYQRTKRAYESEF